MVHDLAVNEAAYAQRRDEILRTYPAHQLVAFASGEIVADAANFEELQRKLSPLGLSAMDVLIVRPADEVPPDAEIFSS